MTSGQDGARGRRRPRIALLSFSTLVRDARVLRHLGVLARYGDVVTVGYGPGPSGAAEHVRVAGASLPQTAAGVALLATRRFGRAGLAAPAAADAVRQLRGRRFDLVVANDARSLPVAAEVAGGAPIWADMHEWAPEERSHVASWRMLVKPFTEDLCARFLPRAAAVTTVSQTIAGLYRSRFGVEAAVVRNAGPWVDLSPSPVQEGRLRLVHSGAAVPGRNLEALIECAGSMGPGTTLDLYLLPAGDGGRYLRRLQRVAGDDPTVRFRAPVAPSALPRVLNAYDVGVYCLPPLNLNAELALPNKVFDFVQARLALAVGPSQEMASIVERHGLGEVAGGFGPDHLRAALERLDGAALQAAKKRADDVAPLLSDSADVATVTEVVDRLLGAAGFPPPRTWPP